MTSTSQLTLLSRGPLFEAQVMRQYLQDRASDPIAAEARRVGLLRDWMRNVGSGGKETALEQEFNRIVLGEVLGYDLFPADAASAYAKAPSSVTGIAREPDVLLGSFTQHDEPTISAVLELKPPGTDLDAPQPRVSRESPVEQAFGYGRSILGVRWVLVTDMRKIRLYSVDSPTEFELFDLAAAVSGDKSAREFRRLYFLLHRDFLLETDQAAGATASLLAKSQARQAEIKSSFYNAYYDIRSDLIAAVSDASEGIDPPPTSDEILEATQRLLDRMVFLYYSEDSPDQLSPRDTTRNVTEAARGLPGTSATKVYSALKALFREVDEDSPPNNVVRLNGYNGSCSSFTRSSTS